MVNKRINGSKTLIAQVRRWVSAGNSIKTLGVITGRNVNTIYSWFRRGNIPLHLRQKVKEVIGVSRGLGE